MNRKCDECSVSIDEERFMVTANTTAGGKTWPSGYFCSWRCLELWVSS